MAVQDTLFDGRGAARKIEDAEALLKENNYRILPPAMCATAVNTINKLVVFFYDTMYSFNPGRRIRTAPVPQDLLYAAKLVEWRMSSGVSRECAFAESCEIIEAIFKYEKYLGLNDPVVSMSIFDVSKIAWVIDKVIAIYEKNSRMINDDLDNCWFETYYENVENKNISEEKYNEIMNRLEEYSSNGEKK